MTGDWTSAKNSTDQTIISVQSNFFFFFKKLSFCQRNLEQEWYRLCSLQCQTHYHDFQLDFTRFHVNTDLPAPFFASSPIKINNLMHLGTSDSGT